MGDAVRSAMVTISENAPSVSLSADPASINNGESTTLSWSSSNADSCTASGAWSGSKVPVAVRALALLVIALIPSIARVVAATPVTPSK